MQGGGQDGKTEPYVTELVDPCDCVSSYIYTLSTKLHYVVCVRCKVATVELAPQNSRCMSRNSRIRSHLGHFKVQIHSTYML